MVDPDRIRPGAQDILGPDQEISADVGICGDHVESAVVIPEGGGIDTAGDTAVFQGQLAFPGQNVTNLLPVHQIPAVPQGNAGKNSKELVTR